MHGGLFFLGILVIFHVHMAIFNPLLYVSGGVSHDIFDCCMVDKHL